MFYIRKTAALAAATFSLALAGAAAAQGNQIQTTCNDDQRSTIAGAIVEAGFMFIDAGNDLTSIQQGGDTTRFDTWFGDHSSDAVDRVQNTLLGAYNALGDADFDCGCNIPPFEQLLGNTPANIVAWTEHNSSRHLVHLCPLFFNLDFYEFTVGTLVHELTHFYGTDDVPEGNSCSAPDNLTAPVADHNLALSNPSGAIDNADNYRTYVINWDLNQPSSFTCPPLD